MTLIAVTLLACTPIEHTESLESTHSLPEIDADCAPKAEDVTLDDGTRLVSRTGRDGDDCRADVYARSNLVDWSVVDEALDGGPMGGANIEWSRVSGRFDRLAVSVRSGATAPAGTEVAVSQLIAGVAAQEALDADPTALLDDRAGLVDDGGFLLGFDTVLTGDETDLTDLVDVVRQNPVAAVTRSFGEDPGMTLVTVASVAVPIDLLAELGAAAISLDVAESVTFSGEVKFQAFGGE